MRNVAIGAVLGFGLVVLLLSVFNAEPPAPLPAPVAQAPAVDADGGAAQVLMPLNVAPVVVKPELRVNNFQRREMMRAGLRDRNQMLMVVEGDAGAAP